MKEIDTQVQQAKRGPNKINAKRSTPRYIIIKMPMVKDKERTLKENLKILREKKLVSYWGVPIRLSVDFSKETYRLEGTGKKYSKS